MHASRAAAYVGTPYVPGESDCWALARRVWAECFGLHVPAIEIDPQALRAVMHGMQSHPERASWQPVEQPEDGDAVLMGRNQYPCHVGVWLDGGILHALEGIGAIHTPPNRLIGLRVLGCWRHISRVAA